MESQEQKALNMLKHDGKPLLFDVEKFCEVVEMFVESDEVKKALWLLDNPPAYYRQYPDKKMLSLKKEIMNRLMTLDTYINDSSETFNGSVNWNKQFDEDYESPAKKGKYTFTYPRAQCIRQLVSELNENNISPLICEMGPSDYWVPHFLKSENLKFYYNAKSLNSAAYLDHKGRLSDVWCEEPKEANIFICFETLEHLWEPMEIGIWANKFNIDFDYVLLSTPKNTLCGGCDTPWRERQDLGHLTTWTPQEFILFAQKTFPYYSFKYVDGPMHVVIGQKIKER